LCQESFCFIRIRAHRTHLLHPIFLPSFLSLSFAFVIRQTHIAVFFLRRRCCFMFNDKKMNLHHNHNISVTRRQVTKWIHIVDPLLMLRQNYFKAENTMVRKLMVNEKEILSKLIPIYVN
jgi:hypothetical protein